MDSRLRENGTLIGFSFEETYLPASNTGSVSSFLAA